MLQYLLKLSISLSIVYLFYQLFLRRLTFYNWNRWYLLIYSMICFIIPVINVFTLVKEPALRESAIINYIPAITQMTTANGEPTVTASAGPNWLQISVVVLITGMMLMIARVLLQYYSLYKMRAKAVLLYDDKVKLYHIDAPVIPFSFGRGIYVNQHQHSEQELKEIIRHEFIHVKQRHSLDIMWSELLCILNWYNPFAWLLRHDIRQNLEFIADQQVLQTGLDRKQYQYLLLKVIGVNSFSIATNFNFSSLKKRIAMMNKTQTARVHLLRFLFMLPLLVVVLLAFRNATQGYQQPLHGAVTDTLPKAGKEPAGLKEVTTIDVTDNRKATVRLKNGKVEHYDLKITKDREAFEQKYGELPEPPEPPAPPAIADTVELAIVPEAPEAPQKLELARIPEAPEAPAKLELARIPEAPEAPAKLELARIPEAPEAPVPPTSRAQVDCFNKKGYCVTIADNNGECVVIVKDKNNKIVEAVTLTDWDKDKRYEEKYGETPSRRLLPKRVMGKPGKPVAGGDRPVILNLTSKEVASVKTNPVVVFNREKLDKPREITPAELQMVEKAMREINLKVIDAVKANNATKLTLDISPEPVPATKEKTILHLKTKPATQSQAKPITLSIKEQPNPARVINARPINKAETVPLTLDKAKPVAAVSTNLKDRFEAKPVETVIAPNSTFKKIAAYVCQNENIIADNSNPVYIKWSKDGKTVTEVIRRPITTVGGLTKP